MQLAIAFDQWYDTRNTKTYLFNPSDAAQKPKIISDRNLKTFTDPGILKLSKCVWQTVLAIENNNLFC
jgi:hypothetical protein